MVMILAELLRWRYRRNFYRSKRTDGRLLQITIQYEPGLLGVQSSIGIVRAQRENNPGQYRRLEAEAIGIVRAQRGRGPGQYRRLEAEAIGIMRAQRGEGLRRRL